MPSVKDIQYNRKQAADYMKKVGVSGNEDDLVNEYIKNNPDDADALMLPEMSQLKSAALGIGSGLTGGLGTKVAPSVFGTKEELELAEAMNPRSFLAGDIAGSIAQTAPLMLIPGVGELKAAQLLAKAPKIAKVTGLTSKTLPMVQKVGQASAISGGIRGAGTTEEGADVNQYLENIGKGALTEGALGTAFGIPAASKTGKALKAGVVGYGLGEGFIDEGAGLPIGGLAAAGSALPVSGSSILPRALGAVGRTLTSERGKGITARLAGANPEEFKKIASDPDQITKIIKDIKNVPIGEKQAQLFDRITAIQNYNTNKLQEAELAVKTLKDEAPKKKAMEVASKSKEILSKIDDIFKDKQNLASKQSAEATRQVEQFYIKNPKVALQGDALSIPNLIKDIDRRINSLKVNGKAPSSPDSRKAIATLKNIKNQIMPAEPVSTGLLDASGAPILTSQATPEKLSVRKYLQIKDDIADMLLNFKPGGGKVSNYEKNLLGIKQLIDNTLKTNMQNIEDPAIRDAFNQAVADSQRYAKAAGIGGKYYSTPEKAESTLKSLIKMDPVLQDLTAVQKAKIRGLEEAAQLANQPGISSDIRRLRSMQQAPVDVNIPNEIQSQLAESQMGKQMIGTNPATVKSLLEKISKPGEQFIPEKRSIPQLEGLREKAFAETNDPIFRAPLTEDVKAYQTRRFLESPTNRGSDISNWLTSLGGSAGNLVLGGAGRVAGSIFGRAAAKDVADRGAVVALKATKWGIDKDKALQKYIAQNPDATRNVGQAYSEAVDKMSPRTFAIFNYLMGTQDLGYRKVTGQAGDSADKEE